MSKGDKVNIIVLVLDEIYIFVVNNFFPLRWFSVKYTYNVRFKQNVLYSPMYRKTYLLWTLEKK